MSRRPTWHSLSLAQQRVRMAWSIGAAVLAGFSVVVGIISSIPAWAWALDAFTFLVLAVTNVGWRS